MLAKIMTAKPKLYLNSYSLKYLCLGFCVEIVISTLNNQQWTHNTKDEIFSYTTFELQTGDCKAL